MRSSSGDPKSEFREATEPDGADVLDVAKEPSNLEGKGRPGVGVNSPGTLRDGHGLRDEAGALRRLVMAGRRGGQEAVLKLLRLRACDAEINRRTA